MSTNREMTRRKAVLGAAGTGLGFAAWGHGHDAFARAAQGDSTPEAVGNAPTRPYLTLDNARVALDAALAKATEIGVAQNVVVLDESATMKAFARQDGALLGSVTIAIDKATTAVSFGAPTHELASGLGQDPVMLASFTKLPNIILIPGGYPIMIGDALVGSIGVSGGSAEQDQQCAEAGLAAISGS